LPPPVRPRRGGAAAPPSRPTAARSAMPRSPPAAPRRPAARVDLLRSVGDRERFVGLHTEAQARRQAPGPGPHVQPAQSYHSSTDASSACSIASRRRWSPVTVTPTGTRQATRHTGPCLLRRRSRNRPPSSLDAPSMVNTRVARAGSIRRHASTNTNPSSSAAARTANAALVREVEEETGLTVTPGRLTSVYKNMALGIVGLVFRCTAAEGSLRTATRAGPSGGSHLTSCPASWVSDCGFGSRTPSPTAPTWRSERTSHPERTDARPLRRRCRAVGHSGPSPGSTGRSASSS
jgi:hypothetical protein